MAPWLHRWRWRRTLIEAGLCLIVARIMLGVLPYRLWLKSAGALQAVPDPAVFNPAPVTGITELERQRYRRVMRVVRAIERVAPLMPLKTECLPRAIAGAWMLRRRRDGDVALLYGVRLTEEGAFEAHAWVTLDGHVVLGSPAASFNVIARDRM